MVHLPRGLRLLWSLAALVLVVALAAPADAGRRKPRSSTTTTTSPTTTETTSTTSSTTPTTTTDTIPSEITSSAATKPSSGDINPTSVPVVDDDFEGLEKLQVDENPALVATLDLHDFVDYDLRDQVSASVANKVATGRDVVVAVLDAGFTLGHPAFKGRVSPWGWDFIDDDADADDYGNGFDDDGDGIVDRAVGHGSLVAAAVLNVAPRATIVPLRVRDDEGLGTDKAVILAIDYAIELGVDIINLSIDVDMYDDEMVWWAVTEAQERGITVVAAAGNSGKSYLPVTTVLTASLIVGSVNGADVISPFSNYSDSRWNRGQMVFAPGENIEGPMIGTGLYTRGSWSGTSFATGVVSGAVALLRELHPDWSPSELSLAVAESVVPVYRTNGLPLRNSGRVDLSQVVAR